MRSSKVDPRPSEHQDRLTIAGIGTNWPNLVLEPSSLREFVEKLYPGDQPEWLQQLLNTNENTGIHGRPVIDYWNSPMAMQPTPATAEQTDKVFRTEALRLAGGAARKALVDSGFSSASITHLVAVTCTNFSCPGYDFLVAQELSLRPDVERILLSGVGCAGGMVALRMASNLGDAASFRGEACRVLIVACEIPSLQLRSELASAAKEGWGSIGPALFADGAASMVLCNPLALEEHTPRLYSVLGWRSCLSPEGQEEMWYRTTQWGFRSQISRQVPPLAARSVSEPFWSLTKQHGVDDVTAVDWALHPGGAAVIKGVQGALDLSHHQLRATWDVYRRLGNMSSVSVLAVLDRLQAMGPGERDVVACSFGPGLMTEMALLNRPARAGSHGYGKCPLGQAFGGQQTAPRSLTWSEALRKRLGTKWYETKK